MAECKDCARYVPNEKFDPKKILSAVGYCRIPVRDTGGLMGTVEAGETLNITFARGPYRCRDGTRWFEPKPSDGVKACRSRLTREQVSGLAPNAQHWLIENLKDGVTAGQYVIAIRAIVEAVESAHGIGVNPSHGGRADA